MLTHASMPLAHTLNSKVASATSGLSTVLMANQSVQIRIWNAVLSHQLYNRTIMDPEVKSTETKW